MGKGGSCHSLATNYLDLRSSSNIKGASKSYLQGKERSCGQGVCNRIHTKQPKKNLGMGDDFCVSYAHEGTTLVGFPSKLSLSYLNCNLRSSSNKIRNIQEDKFFQTMIFPLNGQLGTFFKVYFLGNLHLNNIDIAQGFLI